MVRNVRVINYFDNILILVSGLTAGFILFQSAVVAPTIFSSMPEDQAGPFLRSLFPKLFKSVVGLMILNGFLATFLGEYLLAVGCLVCVASMLFCLFLVPRINKARDERDDVTFNRLHTATVIATLVVLLINLSFSFL